MNLRGIIPPAVTPMTPDHALDLPGLRAHIDHLLAHRVHAVFVLGTTGEFYALDEGEKQAVVAAAVGHCRGRSPVWAGTGAETTREVVRLTKMAEREGADGVSVITPYFLKPTQAELTDHFRRVAEATSLPVVLYSNPGPCGGLAIEPDTAAKLARLPNVVGIKDSSGDLQNTIELLRATPRETFAVLVGRDTLILAGLQAGAAGSIPASGNIAPGLCVGIYESFITGDLAAAKEYQARLHPVRTALALGTGNGAVKEAMALLGRPAGPNRLPVTPLTDEKREKLRQVLAGAGLLSPDENRARG
ncbi:MAG: 4-hydroxy-tetrahydrodipicolinate synthase [Gemmataceae bacterium]|nr:4-hydroxy-tetrahydrodipicolinate synthase [Gemmataceae bacterium]